MIRKLIKKILNSIFPKSCLICNKIIADGSFCIKDWNKLHFLQKPACNICFEPFKIKVGNEIICGKCSQNRPEYFKCLVVLQYNKASKILIKKFKYFDQTNLAKYFANLMFKQAQDILPDIDFIVPIPLHKFRIIKRKYNQSALLAKNIYRLWKNNTSEKNLMLDLVSRTKNNKPQASLNQKARQRNVTGIFEVKEKYLNKIKDKNILLIDDVITTGSTINSCCKALKKAGVKRIYVLTLAKTTFN